MTDALLLAAGAPPTALPVERAEEVLAHPVTVRLPDAPAGVVGLIVWRGDAVAAVDLDALTGGVPLADPPACAVIASARRGPVALCVREPPELVALGEDLGPAGVGWGGAAHAVASAGGHAVVAVLDIDALVELLEAAP